MPRGTIPARRIKRKPAAEEIPGKMPGKSRTSLPYSDQKRSTKTTAPEKNRIRRFLLYFSVRMRFTWGPPIGSKICLLYVDVMHAWYRSVCIAASKKAWKSDLELFCCFSVPNITLGGRDVNMENGQKRNNLKKTLDNSVRLR